MRDLAGFDHRARDRGDVLEVGGRVVERGDARAAAHRLERVAPATRSEVEEALAGRELQPPEVNRQHRYARVDRRRRGVRFELEVVLLGGAFRRLAPGEAVEHPPPAALAEPGALLGDRSASPPAGVRARRRRRSARSSRSRPDGPTTSGSAPPVVVTSGTPHAIASIAGSEKPS